MFFFLLGTGNKLMKIKKKTETINIVLEIVRRTIVELLLSLHRRVPLRNYSLVNNKSDNKTSNCHVHLSTC